MAENSGFKIAEGYVRRDFGGRKGAATRIRQAWRGKGAGGGSGI